VLTNRTDLYDVHFEDVNCQGNYSRYNLSKRDLKFKLYNSSNNSKYIDGTDDGCEKNERGIDKLVKHYKFINNENSLINTIFDIF